MSVKSGGRPAYSDVETQQTFFTTSMGAGEQNESALAEFSEEVLGPNGLDRDQVAELVAARYVVKLGIEEHDIATNQTPGQAKATFALSINAEEAALLGDGDPVDSAEVISDSGAQTMSPGGRVSDDPGRLIEEQVTVSPAFNDTTANTGGGGNSSQSIQFVAPYRNWFEHGPIVDATDDLEGAIRLVHDELGGTSRGTINAHLWWNPLEVEGGRPQFGMPNP